jgi:hypothetical protein
MTAITTDFSQILIRRVFAVTAAILRVTSDGAVTSVVRAFVVIFVRHKTCTPFDIENFAAFRQCRDYKRTVADKQ